MWNFERRKNWKVFLFNLPQLETVRITKSETILWLLLLEVAETKWFRISIQESFLSIKYFPKIWKVYMNIHGRFMKENTQTHICRAINMSNALKQKSNNLNETKPLLHTLFKPSYV